MDDPWNKEQWLSRPEWDRYIADSKEWRAATKEQIDKLMREVACVRRCFDEYVKSNSSLIDELKKEREASLKLRESIIEKTLTGGLWATIVFLAYSAIEYAKAYLKH